MVAPDAATRLAAARAWLGALAPDAAVLVIAPSWEACDDLARAAAVAAGAQFGVVRLTLDRLATRLAARALAARGLTPPSGLAVSAVVARAVDRLAAERRLGRFAPVEKHPGLPTALGRTLDELQLAGIDAAALRTLGSLGADLAVIAEAVERELAADGIAHRALVLETARATVEHGDAPGMAGVPLLLLDVPVASAAEEALVAALAARAPRLLATIVAGDRRSTAALVRACGATPEPAAPVPQPGALGRLQGGVARRGPRVRGDRARHPGRGRRRHPVRSHGGGGARGRRLRGASRGGVRAREHPILLRARDGAPASVGPRAAGAPRLRGRRPLGARLRRVPLAGAGAGPRRGRTRRPVRAARERSRPVRAAGARRRCRGQRGGRRSGRAARDCGHPPCAAAVGGAPRRRGGHRRRRAVASPPARARERSGREARGGRARRRAPGCGARADARRPAASDRLRAAARRASGRAADLDDVGRVARGTPRPRDRRASPSRCGARDPGRARPDGAGRPGRSGRGATRADAAAPRPDRAAAAPPLRRRARRARGGAPRPRGRRRLRAGPRREPVPREDGRGPDPARRRA